MIFASCCFKIVLNSTLVVILAGIPEIVFAQSSQGQPASSPVTDSDASPPKAEERQPAGPEQSQQQSQPLPDSPGNVQAQSTAAPATASSSQRVSSTERPLGTAAAEIGNASGTSASKPAGFAIAPAKQHQSRSLLIKLGAVVGVGIAVGTVMALSSSSPSRPPGSQ